MQDTAQCSSARNGAEEAGRIGLRFGCRLFLLVPAAIALWVITHVPPFSALDASSARARADFLNTFLAAWYPGDHRRDIVIVELDKAWLLGQHQGTSREGFVWPPLYETQAEVFEMAATLFAPRAIFIDIWWEHIRPEEAEDFDAIERFLCAMGRDSCREGAEGPRCARRDRMGEGDTPVVLAHYSTNDADEGFARLNALVEDCPHLSWAWIERFDDYGRQTWYRLAGDNGMPTPAVVLYQQLCARAGQEGPESAAARCKAALERIATLQQENAALSVIWGPTRIGKWYDDDGAPCLDDPILHSRNAREVPCPYTPRLNTGALERLYKGPSDTRLSEFVSAANGMRHGPIVMIGGAVDLNLDRMRTGNTDQTPVTGVHLHAMALDNLLQWGPNVPATSLGWGQLPIYWTTLGDPLDLLRLALAIAIAAWLMLADDFATYLAEYCSRFAGAITVVILVNFVAIVLGWFVVVYLLWQHFNLGLEQWIGTSFYSGAVGLMSKSFVRRLHLQRQVSP